MEPKSRCGLTSSAIALATQIAIDHNMKILLVSTSLNDSLIKDSFWKEKKKKPLEFFGVPTNNIDRTGVEGLDRIIRSNKITPEIITDYTKIVLTNRLEVLLGVDSSKAQYEAVKEKYAQIITLANQYYDMVIVDLDKNIGYKIEEEILKKSNIIVSLISQRKRQIEEIKQLIDKNELFNNKNTILAIGNYKSDTKYNVKNISRNILKRKKEIINIIPYNNLFFEATQEGNVVDLFLNFMRIKEYDSNYMFVQELRKIYESIHEKLSLISGL